MSLLEEWALSKEGIGSLIVFSIALSFGLGYNWYRVEGALSQVHNNRKMISENGTRITENDSDIKNHDRRLEAAKDRRQELNRTLRIIACNSNDLADNATAQNMLNCGEFQ